MWWSAQLGALLDEDGRMWEFDTGNTWRTELPADAVELRPVSVPPAATEPERAAADELSREGQNMRLDEPAPVADPPGCDHPDTVFDRSICPTPCDTMHNHCSECGVVLDDCPHLAPVSDPVDVFARPEWITHETKAAPDPDRTGEPAVGDRALDLLRELIAGADDHRCWYVPAEIAEPARALLRAVEEPDRG